MNSMNSIYTSCNLFNSRPYLSWFSNYERELNSLYSIVIDFLSNRYEGSNINYSFDEFTQFIYRNSSGIVM